jgi:hypothetical protein
VHIAVKLGAALDEPFALEDITLHSSVSVGVALFRATQTRLYPTSPTKWSIWSSCVAQQTHTHDLLKGGHNENQHAP